MGVVATLTSQNNVATRKCFDVLRIQQSIFTFSHFLTIQERYFTASLTSTKKYRLNQVKIFFSQHSLHENATNHTAPTN